MERDHLGRRRLPYLSGCVAGASPACFTTHDGARVDYSRIHGGRKRTGGGGRWRYLLRKWVKDSMSTYGSKSLSFQYDAVSYSQNFDEGRHYDANRENEMRHGRS